MIECMVLNCKFRDNRGTCRLNMVKINKDRVCEDFEVY